MARFPAETLREALLDLDEARKREAEQRETAEALLAGLHALVVTTDPQEIFPRLFDVLRQPLGFEAAFVLALGDDGVIEPLATSAPVFDKTRWQPAALFNRVIAGETVAIFDALRVEEWHAQPEPVRRSARSLLLFPILTTERKALFIGTHSERAHFSRQIIRRARRFSTLATEALQKLEAGSRLAHLEQRLAAEARMTALNRQLAESERKLARAQKVESLGLLAGGVAHDLNNILSGIVTYPDLLLLDQSLDAETRDTIETIRDSGFRAAAVVSDLLTVTRGVASPRQSLQLNDLVQRYLSSPEHDRLVCVKRAIEIEALLDPGLPEMRACRSHVEKSLMNLVSNAVDAVESRAGRITISTHSRHLDRSPAGHEEAAPGQYVVLAVSDTGSGILPDDLERIFEPFFARKKMGRSGTGLGLTIVWNTVQDHGGFIDVKTSARGTAFELHFPAGSGDEREEAPEEQVSLDDITGQGELILVVDDDPGQRKIACAILRELGYEATAVTSGEEAVQFVARRPVALVVLDMLMEGIDGRETYRRLCAISPEQKAVIASGYSPTMDVEEAQSLGAGQYLKKPYTMMSLGVAIHQELLRDDRRAKQ